MLTFFIYSVIGFGLETFFCSIDRKRVVSRGFLFGPYLPIFGFGTLLILAVIDKIGTGIFQVFWTSLIICTVVEYLTSVLMEKLFHIRWWDYSEAEKYNINGRISLSTSLLFGIGGCAIILWAHPKIKAGLALIPLDIQTIIAIVLFIIMLIDTLISYATTRYAGKTLDFGKMVGDSTAEVKKQARKAVKQFFKRFKQKKH